MSRPGGFWASAARVFELSLGEMLWSRRAIFMAIVVGGPILLALVVRLVQASGVEPVHVNGVAVGGAGIFGTMVWILFIRFVVPVLGVFYGTALIADEIEDRTITYLFTRPIPRGAVLMGKYLAYLVCTALAVLPALVMVYFLLVPFGEVPASFGQLVADLGLVALGLSAYGAVFALIGTVMRRPLVVGLLFAFGWEPIALFLPGDVRRFTLAQYLQSLVPHARVPGDGLALFQAATSVACLLAVLVVCLALAVRAIERREYAPGE
jgi:ABC-2 type transport system permease protein